MVKYIIFDVMGVIFTVGDDVENLLVPYVRSLKPETTIQQIKDAYMSASLGHISSRKLWELVGFEQTEILTTEHNYLENCFTLDDGFLPCAKALKKRYGIALLSNDISEWSKYLREFHRIEPLVDAAFISGDIGVRKPDAKIYRIALEALGIKPSECVFVDDNPERIEAASELGICSILFNREGHGYQGLRVKAFGQLTKLLI
ncbi:MAG: HAD family phosphatase [Clostridiales bacterium]|nr:HAD family phosphatase [Clostridiales bacterium]